MLGQDVDAPREVVDCGVDLSLFGTRSLTGPGPVNFTGPGPVKSPANGPVFVCVGSLIERKNVVRLADAFATLDEGSLVFAGDGPLRGQLEGRERVRLLGRVAHEKIADLMASLKAAEKRIQAFEARAVLDKVPGLLESATRRGAVTVVAEDAGTLNSADDLRLLVTTVRERLGSDAAAVRGLPTRRAVPTLHR